MDKEIEGILNRKDERMCMDEKLCNERMKKTEEHQARQDLRLDNHSTRLDQLEQYRAGFEIQIGHLCEKIDGLIKTIQWGGGLLVSVLVGFFIWYIQNIK